MAHTDRVLLRTKDPGRVQLLAERRESNTVEYRKVNYTVLRRQYRGTRYVHKWIVCKRERIVNFNGGGDE